MRTLVVNARTRNETCVRAFTTYTRTNYLWKELVLGWIWVDRAASASSISSNAVSLSSSISLLSLFFVTYFIWFWLTTCTSPSSIPSVSIILFFHHQIEMWNLISANGSLLLTNVLVILNLCSWYWFSYKIKSQRQSVKMTNFSYFR